MKTKDKGLYKPPTLEVVEMKMQNVVCASQFLVVFLLTDDPTTEFDWGRTTYGDTSTDTWN